MILKNLLRRKARTFLTMLGISIGVAAIIGLGAMADGMDEGYTSVLTGSKADLVLSQPNTFDLSYSSVDETLGIELLAMPEVASISGMLQGFVQTENAPLFFVFGYPYTSFSLKRFQIIEGVGFTDPEVTRIKGRPLILGTAAAESLKKELGDTINLSGSSYRIIGLYQTGDAFEDSGAVVGLEDAQQLMGKPRQVSLFYIQLKDPELGDRLKARVERRWPDLEMSTGSELAGKQSMAMSLKIFVWVIAGMALILGGVGMMNAQMMAVFERTREIGVLRAVGWKKARVMRMIMGESILVCIAGGTLGIILGWLLLVLMSQFTILFGGTSSSIKLGLVIQAYGVVLTLGLVGGLYPAWRAARFQPSEALRYEGGSSGQNARRLPIGGMAVQSLWQRSTRTLLTLGVISLTVGSILFLDSEVQGMISTFSNVMGGEEIEILVRQADVADSSLSVMDTRIGSKIAAMPDVASVSGMMFTAVVIPETGSFLILQGYNPNEFAIRRFKVSTGERIYNNRQIMIGKMAAEAMNKKVGDTMELTGSRFKVVGVFETGIGWEETGAVISLRDAQTLMGRPRKVTMYAVKVKDPENAADVAARINVENPEVFAALSGDFVDQMPDMKNSNAMMSAISFLAVVVGGLGVMNTMLMSVLERTREIGVLRAVGWGRKAILEMIIKESLLLGILGGMGGICIGFLLFGFSYLIPGVKEYLTPIWNVTVFSRAITTALVLGVLGGIYPAIRATRFLPVEALRYE